MERFDTRNKHKVPRLQPNHDYEIINEDLEYAFPVEDLEYIKDFSEDRKIEQMADDLKRNEWEVLWAYVHLIRKGYQLPPLCTRRIQGE